MNILNAAATNFFSLVMRPFTNAHPLVALSMLSIITGAAMALIFKKTTNQAAIGNARKRMQARLIEIRLFADDPALVIRSAYAMMADNAVYLRHALAAMLVMLIPVSIILIQASGYFSRRPARTGEPVVITAKLSGSTANLSANSISLEVPPGVNIETPVIFAPDLNEASWRISASAPGSRDISIKLNGKQFNKNFSAGPGLMKIWPAVSSGGFLQSLLNPAEPPLQEQSPGVKQISVDYPPRAIYIAGRSVNWLVFFFIISILAGLFLKPVLKVEM